MNSCWEVALAVILTRAALIVMITASITFLSRKVMPQYKIKTAGLSFAEMLTSLNTIIENEIELYEKSIFEGGGKIGSNAQFENYYKDLVERILGDLSDEFFNRMCVYMSKEALVAFICRLVKAYLGEKVV